MSLPRGWISSTIGEVFQINPKHPPETDRQQLVSFVAMPSVDEHTGSITSSVDRLLGDVWSGYTHFADGDVIFAKITPCMENGKAAVAKRMTNSLACGSTEFYVLRADGAAIPEYLWRYLRQKSFREDAERHMNGAVGQQRVPKQYLEQHPFPLPPIAEQRRIVEKLDALKAYIDRARAELNRTAQLAERFRLSALRAGVSGELTEDWRAEATGIASVDEILRNVPVPQQGRGGREATDKVIPGIAALAVNDPGTILPVGWKWVSLLRVAKQETGHTPSRSQPSYWDGGVPWIGIRDAGAYHGRYIEDTIQKISDAGLANSSARLLPPGTVCLSRTASVGYVTIMGRSMATSQDFATWTCTKALLPEYLMYALMAEGDDIRQFGMGTTHTTIYFPEIRALHIALPPLEEQRDIIARIAQALARADRLQSESGRGHALLDRLESAILSKAFKGELVPQDPNDEPANVLLDRIQAQRASAPKKRGRQRNTVTA